MSKYISRYHWPNGYKLEQFRGSWLFAPFLGGYGNKQIVDYFCRGKTPEEAEQLAYNQVKVKPSLNVVSRIEEITPKSDIKKELLLFIKKYQMTSTAISKRLKVSHDMVLSLLAGYVFEGKVRFWVNPKNVTYYRFNIAKKTTVNQLADLARQRLLKTINEANTIGVPATIHNIAERAHMSRTRVIKLLLGMKRKGLVEKVKIGGHKGNGYFVYSVKQ